MAGIEVLAQQSLGRAARLISAITAGRLARSAPMKSRRRRCAPARISSAGVFPCRGDLGALRGEDALEDAHAFAFTFCVKATNSSSFCLAAPLLIACTARSTPDLSVLATPAT